MNSARRLGVAVVPAILLSLFLTVPCYGQLQQAQQPSGNGGIHTIHDTPPDVETLSNGAGDPVFEERRMRQLNAAQHKSLVSDTDKLLKMVSDLNAEIMNTNPSSLSADQLRRVAEIEKLAHNVKDKMRTSVRGNTVYMDESPLQPLPRH